MKKSSLSRRVALGLAAMAVTFTGMVFTAPSARAAFSCDALVIDGAQSLTIPQEDSLSMWMQVFPLNGIDLRIITTPNLTSEGGVVPYGEDGGGTNVSPYALQNYILQMKDYCPSWSDVSNVNGEPVAKKNLIIIAVAPYNQQSMLIQGADTPVLKQNEVDEVLGEGVQQGYALGDPNGGFQHAVWSLAWILFGWRWLLMMAAAILVIAVVGTIIVKKVNRRAASRTPSRS